MNNLNFNYPQNKKKKKKRENNDEHQFPIANTSWHAEIIYSTPPSFIMIDC